MTFCTKFDAKSFIQISWNLNCAFHKGYDTLIETQVALHLVHCHAQPGVHKKRKKEMRVDFFCWNSWWKCHLRICGQGCCWVQLSYLVLPGTCSASLRRVLSCTTLFKHLLPKKAKCTLQNIARKTNKKNYIITTREEKILHDKCKLQKSLWILNTSLQGHGKQASSEASSAMAWSPQAGIDIEVVFTYCGNL